jgi:hypothetical protein
MVTAKELICKGLGYCCEWAFFKAHKHVRTGLIAARLGMAETTVHNKRIDFSNGDMKCTNQARCLEKLKREIKRRKKEA